MFQNLKKLYVLPRFYYAILFLIGLFILSFLFPILYFGAWASFLIFAITILVDFSLLFYSSKNGINATRVLPEKLSNGDENPIKIHILNKYSFKIDYEIIDEIPFQFQIRNFSIKRSLGKKGEDHLQHTLRPTFRGEYHFGKMNIYVNSPLKLLAKHFIFSQDKTISCYPSFIQMKKYDLIAFAKNKLPFGFKKIRKIGHTTEFEQIKEYVPGDDIRTINWKATAKKNQLMVNQYQDENMQSIFIIIDKGRVMQMPFKELSLLDYAINASLALANVILKKNDRVGLLTFSKKTDNRIKAACQKTQLHHIMEQLYRVKTNFVESDFGKLYTDVKYQITHRSLLIIFTNFETLEGLQRQLPYLRAIAKNHLLLLVFFENTELNKLTSKKAENVQDIFDKTIAEKFNFEKRLIVNELNKYGIQAILTPPEDLTINTINKYLEIKAKGIL